MHTHTHTHAHTHTHTHTHTRTHTHTHTRRSTCAPRVNYFILAPDRLVQMMYDIIGARGTLKEQNFYELRITNYDIILGGI